jgi:N-acetylneuraminic acid mutarotase/tRNA A-37 threonylcarbamoyl transferase component Bud32
MGGLCAACVAPLAFGSWPKEGNAHEPKGNALAESAGKPRRLGDYELLEEIGRGGMGVIYRARQLSLNRTVAVKMILAGQLASEIELQRFRAEAEAAASLLHPNIVRIHEVGELDGQHFFSMDYIEGQNLAEATAGREAKDVAWCRCSATYVKTIAEAIHYAHQRGTLHRDLKPSNILIDGFGQPHVTDFGLAKRLKHDSDLTLTGQVLGTPNFMPPEQASSKTQAVGPQSDVYSLGSILYFLLTGRPPFSGDTLAETVMQVLKDEPPRPRTLNRAVPIELETVCLKCLEKQPQRRYASAQELADELGRFLRDEPILARPVGRARMAWRWCRRRPALMTAGAAVIMIAATLFLAGRMMSDKRKQTVAHAPFRGGNGLSALLDGKIYLMMPCTGEGEWQRDMYAYDPGENSWSSAVDIMPFLHRGGCGGVINGNFYVAGGLDEKGTPLDRLSVFDGKATTWSGGPPMSTTREGAAASVLNDKLYVIGGTTGNATNVLSSVEIYDPLAHEWKAGPPLPFARTGLGAAQVGGVIYAAGGKDAQGRYSSALQALDHDGKWVNLSSLLQPVADAFVAAANGILYLIGGETGPRIASDSVQAYDPVANKWKVLKPMPKPRFDGCGAQWINGKLYVIGGWTFVDKMIPHDDVFVYDPARDTWGTRPGGIQGRQAESQIRELRTGDGVPLSRPSYNYIGPVAEVFAFEGDNLRNRTDMGPGACVAVDANNGHLWCPVMSNSLVVVRDGKSGKVITNLTLADCPGGVAVDSVHRIAWITAQCGMGSGDAPANDYVWAIKTDTFVPIQTQMLSGGVNGGPEIVNPVTGRFYHNVNGCQRFDRFSFLPTHMGYGVVRGVDPDASRLYALDERPDGRKVLQILEAGPDPEVVITNIILGFRVGAEIGVNPLRNRMYIPNAESNTIGVLDDRTGEWEETIDVDGGLGIDSIRDVVCDPQRDSLYVTALNSRKDLFYLFAIRAKTQDAVLLNGYAGRPVVNSALNRVYVPVIPHTGASSRQ